MACGKCWKPNRSNAVRYGSQALRYGSNGLVTLADFPDCTSPYTGPLDDTEVYVVAYGTELERAFPSGQVGAAEAFAWSRQAFPPFAIERVTAGQLCADAVESLFGPQGA